MTRWKRVELPVECLRHLRLYLTSQDCLDGHQWVKIRKQLVSSRASTRQHQACCRTREAGAEIRVKFMRMIRRLMVAESKSRINKHLQWWLRNLTKYSNQFMVLKQWNGWPSQLSIQATLKWSLRARLKSDKRMNMMILWHPRIIQTSTSLPYRYGTIVIKKGSRAVSVRQTDRPSRLLISLSETVQWLKLWPSRI